MTDDQAFAQLDKDKLKQEIENDVKQAAVEAAKESLIESIQGKKERYSWEERGQEKPASYDELFQEVEKRLPKLSTEDVEKVVEKRLQEQEEARKKEQEEAAQQTEEQKKQRTIAFDQEWQDLIKQGKMPEPSKEILEEAKKRQLSLEEIKADEGLRARLELAELVQRTGKSAKVAYYEDYNQQPAGASAPVLGGRPTTPQSQTEEFAYEDIASDRKKFFGF